MTLLQSVFLPLALLASAALADGFLGVQLEDADPPTVKAVIDNTAAAKAGLRTGDVFLAVNGVETPTVDGFIAAVRGFDAGDRVRFDIRRDGRKISKRIVLGSRPVMEEAEEVVGEEVEEVTEEEVEEEEAEEEEEEEEEEAEELRPRRRAGGPAYLGIVAEEGDGALTVARVVEGGPAANAGLQPGDQLLRLGRARGFETLESLSEALSQLRAGQTVRVQVQRGERRVSMSLQLGARRGEEAAAGPDREEQGERAVHQAEEERRRVESEARAVEERAEREARAAERQARAAEREARQRAERAARTERRARAERAGAREGTREGAREMRELRQELRALRKEIAELKELVRKLGR